MTKRIAPRSSFPVLAAVFLFGFLQLIWTAPLRAQFLPNAEDVAFPAATLKPGSVVDTALALEFQDDFHLNPEAPSKISLWLEERPSPRTDAKVVSPSQEISLPRPADLEKATLKGTAVIYYCRTENHAVCYIKSFKITQPVEFSGEAKATQITLKLPKLVAQE